MSATSLVTTRLLAVQSVTHPLAKFCKFHNALSFHWVQEASTSKYILMMHMPSMDNPADNLSKHRAYQAVYPILKAICFLLGNMADLIQEG
jgi:hypothetical protein